MATHYDVQAWYMKLGFGADQLVSSDPYQHTCTWRNYSSEREALALIKSQPVVQRYGDASRWTLDWNEMPASPGGLPPQRHETWPAVVGELQGKFLVFRYELEEVRGKGRQVESRRLLRSFNCPGYAKTADLRRLLEQDMVFYEDRTDELAEAIRQDIRAGLKQLDIDVARLAVVEFVGREEQQLLAEQIQQREQAELATIRRGADGYLSRLRQPTTQQLLEQVAALASSLEASSD